MSAERSLRVNGPAPETTPVTHLVLGYRDDDAGRAALRVGADLAERLTATLHVVHVVDLADYPIDPDDPDWERRAREHLAQEQRQVEAAMAESRCTWSYHAARGDPVGLLRRVADAHDALLFVVGTRGEGVGEVVSRLLGVPSVSHGLIARSHRPVVVCHASGHTHTET